MKLKKIFTICLFVIISCCGCENKNEIQVENINLSTKSEMVDGGSIGSEDLNKNIINYDFPDTYQDKIENVQFDTKIIVSKEINQNGLYSTKIQLKERNYDKVCDIVFEGVEIETRDEQDAGVGEKYGKSLYCVGTDNRTLYMNNRILTASNESSRLVMRTISMEAGEEYNADMYLTGEEFEFMSIDEAYQSVLQYLSDIGIDIEDNDNYKYNCYSLNYKTMEEVERAIKENTQDTSSYTFKYKDKWTQEDNTYLFAIHQYCQDCVVQYPAGGVFPKISDANAPIIVLISQNGIERVDSAEIFDFEQGNEILDLLKFEDIASNIAEKYNMLLTDSKYIVEEAVLYWRPSEKEDLTFDLIPVWEVSVKDVKLDKSICIYMNALTGKEID